LPLAGIVSDEEEDRRYPSPARAKQTPKAPSTGRSSAHDDSIGHFRGGPGTIIADRFKIIEEVGLGTFGRVVECLDLRAQEKSARRQRNRFVAIKIVRDIKRYYKAAIIEADILEDVNRRGGRGVTHCAVMYDAFTFANHYCLVFECLGPSLYDFLKSHKYKPFPMYCIEDFSRQLLEALEFMHSFGLIHTDL